MNRSIAPLFALLSIVVAAGCGAPASNNAPDAPPGHRHHGPEEEHGRHDHHFEGGMKDYHDVLAPIWHQEKGLARTDGACAKAASLAALARVLENDPAPGKAAADATGWKSDAHELVLASDALGTACAVEGRPDVEARLGAVHEGFHALLERTKK